MNIKRGDIFYADLSPVVGCEQGGIRPVLVVQNDSGNKYSSTVIVAAITSKIDKVEIPTHIYINDTNCGLVKESLVLLEQIRTIDHSRLLNYCGSLSTSIMIMINEALYVSVGLPN
jgi:mRNA interferase MazF